MSDPFVFRFCRFSVCAGSAAISFPTPLRLFRLCRLCPFLPFLSKTDTNGCQTRLCSVSAVFPFVLALLPSLSPPPPFMPFMPFMSVFAVFVKNGHKRMSDPFVFRFCRFSVYVRFCRFCQKRTQTDV